MVYCAKWEIGKILLKATVRRFVHAVKSTSVGMITHELAEIAKCLCLFTPHVPHVMAAKEVT